MSAGCRAGLPNGLGALDHVCAGSSFAIGPGVGESAVRAHLKALLGARSATLIA